MKYLLSILFATITLFFGFELGVRMGHVQSISNDFTGRQVLEELDNYRISQGLPEFEVSGYLCDNIAKRWANYIENNSHEGLDEFIKEQHPDISIAVAEILAPGRTAKGTVQNWIDSPSHEQYITRNSKVCVYSAGGFSVALLSN